MAENSLDIDAEPDEALFSAIDLARDQDQVTWLTYGTRRVAAIVPVDTAEFALASMPPWHGRLQPRDVVTTYKAGDRAPEYRTKAGRLLTDAEVEALKAEERTMRKPRGNRFSHADIDYWLPDLGQRLDSLSAKVGSPVSVARLAAVIEALIYSGVIMPHQIGLPAELISRNSPDMAAAVRVWLTS